MGTRMVRQPSETPNVTNIDDIIPFRYAYGDQDGYVIGKGNEISYTIDGSTFRVNSGRVVLQGVETDIDANGVSFTIDNASETRYFVVYYEVNLATQTTDIKLSNYSTSGYPTIDTGDDLTANSSGIARLPLYRFTATSGVIGNVDKVASSIVYVNENKIKELFSKDYVSKFGDYIFSKKKIIWNNDIQLKVDPNLYALYLNMTTVPIEFITLFQKNKVYELIGYQGLSMFRCRFNISGTETTSSVILYNDYGDVIRLNNVVTSSGDIALFTPKITIGYGNGEYKPTISSFELRIISQASDKISSTYIDSTNFKITKLYEIVE